MIRQKAVGFIKSLSINHAKRLYNGGTQQAVQMVTQLGQSTAPKNPACPYCAMSCLDYDGKYWQCNHCHYKAPVKINDIGAIYTFLDKYARSIYLSGKGNPISAYEMGGGFINSDTRYKKRITICYGLSQIALVIVGYAIYCFVTSDSVIMAVLYLLMIFVAFMYSLFYAFRGYTLATRQLYVDIRIPRLHIWLDTVGWRYFLNVAVGSYFNLAQIIMDFQEYEQAYLHYLNQSDGTNLDDGSNQSSTSTSSGKI